MRIWPWGRAETRAGYTDGIVSLIVAAAGGNVAPNGAETAAAELAAGAYAGALAQAEVDPAGMLSPDLLAMIGRECVLRGEFVAAIDVDAQGALRFTPASTWEVHGGALRESWEYVMQLASPDGESTRRMPASGVIHCTYSTDARTPWAGRSPLTTWTARTAGGAERQLANESARDSGYLLPVPDSTPQDKLEAFLMGMRRLEGKGMAVETPAAGWGNGLQQSPRGMMDYAERRIGAAPPDALVKLRQHTAGELLGAFGIHADLLTVEPASNGPAAREHWRRWIEGWVKPLCNRIAGELSEKLEQPVKVSAPRMLTSDVRSFASAYQALTSSGKPADEAARLLGLDDG